MSTINFSVRLLSGKVLHFNEEPDTPILAIKQKLQVDQNLSEFQTISLLFGEVELTEGSLSEVDVTDATELQAVLGMSKEKPLQAMMQAMNKWREVVNVSCISSSLWDNMQETFARVCPEIVKAASFLLEFKDETHEHIFEAAYQLMNLCEMHWMADGMDLAPFSGSLFQLYDLACQLYGKFAKPFPAELILQGIMESGISMKISTGDGHDIVVPMKGVSSAVQTRVKVIARNALEKINARKVVLYNREADNAETEKEEVDIEEDSCCNRNKDERNEVNSTKTQPEKAPDVVESVATQADQYSHDLEVAIRESATEAMVQEGSHVQEALLRSKIESARQQVVVVLRLTKRNSDVLDVLLKDEFLQDVRAHVEEAGCEVLPEWAGGAIILVPLTEKEARDAGVDLRAHHIVTAQVHQSRIENALVAIPKRRRPVARRADPEYLGAASSEVATHTPWEDIEWCVERTFVHCPAPTEGSTCSARSEPWGGVVAPPLKLPRLSK